MSAAPLSVTLLLLIAACTAAPDSACKDGACESIAVRAPKASETVALLTEAFGGVRLPQLSMLRDVVATYPELEIHDAMAILHRRMKKKQFRINPLARALVIGDLIDSMPSRYLTREGDGDDATATIDVDMLAQDFGYEVEALRDFVLGESPPPIKSRRASR
jgi:hypothetical protein